ncbi:MAG: radical SAM protein [Bryobacterales bacterium]|nr:radical SAM protein [Bryobacterales bacterium]
MSPFLPHLAAGTILGKECTLQKSDILQAWKGIVAGRRPSLSIEVTRECPLRCPGCYAYEPAHLGGLVTLRELNDSKGDELVNGVLRLVDFHKPLHLSLVGGDPLVRYRELERLMPHLVQRNIFVQVVTSAFRQIPTAWKDMPRVKVVVSIDGLREDHDIRRKPATYDRILKNIDGQRITIHSTITSQMMKRPGYLDEFLAFWAPRQEIEKIWMSMFTPQRGATDPEILTPEERRRAVEDMTRLRRQYPKLEMHDAALRQFLNPPKNPDDCIFAKTTHTVSADFKTKITPCQFGGDPDCSQCGCMASMVLGAVGEYRVGGIVPVKSLFQASFAIGKLFEKEMPDSEPAQPKPQSRAEAA